MEHHGRLRQVPPPPPDDGLEAEESKLVLDAVQDVLAQQRSSAERLRSQARQTFVFVSVLFTIAQTAAFTSFGENEVSGPEQRLMLLCGIAAVVGVGVTGWLALRGDKLQVVEAVAVADILRYVNDERYADVPVSDVLIKLYDAEIAKQKSVITGRRRNAGYLGDAVTITVLLVIAEIAVAFIARIP